jgi:hypothetical protein
VALLVTFFVLAPHPFKWILQSYVAQVGFNGVLDGSLLRTTLWLSPPQSLGAALFATIVLLLIGLLRSEVRGVAGWLALAVLLIVVSGSKASYIPLLLAGLACAIGVGLLRRQVSQPALIAAGLALCSLGFAMFVLLGGEASGLALDPMQLLRLTGLGWETGLFGEPIPALAYVTMLGICALCWAAIWCGLIGLRGTGATRKPELVMLVGIGAAGIAAALLFGHPGLSQDAFFQGLRPYLSIAAVVGFAAIVTSSGLGRRAIALASAAAAAGLLAVLTLRLLGSRTMPVNTGQPGGRRSLVIALGWPYLVLAALIIVAAVILFRSTRTRAAAPVLVLAALMGMGLETSLHDRIYRPVHRAIQTQWQPNIPSLVADGSLEAGRWIRDHSDPSDVVATNAHCLYKAEVCNNARFTAAAFTERRILIEGWGYNTRAQTIAEQTDTFHAMVPYWNPELLTINDAAFFTPSPQTLGRLRDEYGVRWLFVDRSANEPAPNLGEFATLRFTSGVCDVYEVLPAA